MACSVGAETGGRVPARFCVGDIVDVLRSVRLPIEDVLATGTVERITEASDGNETLYWVSGFPCAKTARCLRLVQRGERNAQVHPTLRGLVNSIGGGR